MRLLIVKLSSLGDVIQTLPVLADIARFSTDARVEWVVEEGYADLLRLHGGIERVIPAALRRWRRQGWLSSGSRAEFMALREALRSEPYDLVIDLQGLLKSAWVARMAGAPVAGAAWKTAREPLAALFYQHRISLPQLPAPVRYRLLAAKALGYERQTGFDAFARNAGDFGLGGGVEQGRQVVLAHVSARDDKLWSERNWIELGRRLAASGLQVLLPWGSDAERRRAERLAAEIPGARVLSPLSLADLARLFAGCRGLFGLDTGLTYLAIACGVPTVRLYCGVDRGATADFDWSCSRSIGQPGAAPTVDEAWQTWQDIKPISAAVRADER